MHNRHLQWQVPVDWLLGGFLRSLHALRLVGMTGGMMGGWTTTGRPYDQDRQLGRSLLGDCRRAVASRREQAPALRNFY